MTRQQFVAAMGNAATGVTVVATDGPAGRFAQTVSAMCSVSADPPSLLVCVNRRSPLVEAVRHNGVFSVNVLGVGQAHVSDTFAGRPGTGEPYDFGCARWQRLETDAPVLAGAAAAFDCRLAETTASGTHLILVGTVLASSSSAQAPLLYHARAYGAHRPIDVQQIDVQQGVHAR
ncbi:flavin reductase family protein [Streptomyces sp. SYSU K217416]